MDYWEQHGASNFARASEEDPYVAESSFFTDFDHAKAGFQHWLAIEEELYLSIGYENFLMKCSQKQSAIESETALVMQKREAFF